MAEDQREEQGEEASGGGKKNLILFAVVLLVAIGGSVGGTMFFLGGEPEVEAPVVVSNKPKVAIYHNMRPPYVINYLTGAKPRYLQAEFSIMARDEAVIEAVILHMPLIRSELVSFLTEQNFVELQTQEGKESVRQGIVDLINNTLSSHDEPPGIEAALITNFVLQ